MRVDGMPAVDVARAASAPSWSRCSPRRSRVVATPASPVAAAPPAFVQARALEINGGTVNSTSFTNANTAGNLIVVYVVWSNAGTVSVSDTRGNTYAPAQAATRWNSNQWSAQVFYAKDIAGGANTVRATFGTTINAWGIVYAHEYSGLDRTNPLDVSRSAIGTAAAMSTGNATTTNANDLIFGAGASTNSIVASGAGLTARSTAYDNRTMDRTVTTAGNYAVTATQNGNAWVMQLVAFRAASDRHRGADRADGADGHSGLGVAGQPGVDGGHRQHRRHRLSHPPQRHPDRHQHHDVVQRHHGDAGDGVHVHGDRGGRRRQRVPAERTPPRRRRRQTPRHHPCRAG